MSKRIRIKKFKVVNNTRTTTRTYNSFRVDHYSGGGYYYQQPSYSTFNLIDKVAIGLMLYVFIMMGGSMVLYVLLSVASMVYENFN